MPNLAGGLPGFAPTAIHRGKKIDRDDPNVQQYKMFLEEEHVGPVHLLLTLAASLENAPLEDLS